MNRSIWLFPALLSIVFFTSSAYSATLDRSGKAPLHDSYTCAGVHLDPSAGGMPNWKITLKGLCARLPAGAIVGWDPLQWTQVTVFGRYHYDTNHYEEDIFASSKLVFSVKGTCQKNPWAHGSSASTCAGTNELINVTEAFISPPYPFSAKYMTSTLRTALAKGEQTLLAGDPLQDWDPYENTGGAAAVSITKPLTKENIDPNLSTYNLVITKNKLLPAYLKIEIEQLEEVPAYQGDIKMPDTYSHWWQPVWHGRLSNTSFPLPLGINSGPFSGGSYRIRVRGNQGLPNVVDIGGWTDWRYFCVGVTGPCGTQLKLANKTAAQLLSQKILSTFGKNEASTAQQWVPASMKSPLKPAISAAASGFGTKVPHRTTPNTLVGNKFLQSLTAQSRATLGLTQIKPRQIDNQLPTVAAIGRPKQPASLRSPKRSMSNNHSLSVRSLSYSPAAAKEGSLLLLTIRFWNNGPKAGGHGQQYTVGCKILSGTRCPVQAGVYKIGRDLGSRQDLRVRLRSTTPATAGKYQITVALNGARGRPFSQTIQIERTISSQAATAVREKTSSPSNSSPASLAPARLSNQPANRTAPLPMRVPAN